jgi:hypothetical protein
VGTWYVAWATNHGMGQPAAERVEEMTRSSMRR